jgi:hypothetical protein
MTLPRTVADVLSQHVVFEIESIDRMFLNVYIPQLQHPRALVGYVHQQLGLPIASTAPLAQVSERFEKTIHAFSRDQDVPIVGFARGQRKDDVMHEHLARFLAEGHGEGVLFIGRAQEKTPMFRTEKRRRDDGSTYPWIVKTTAMINHWYFYAFDADFGPFFVKFAGYFPYNAKLCINGNEWGAPCGALSYPRHNREEFGGTFLGSMAHLDPKGEGDGSMPEKQRPLEDTEGGALRNPRDTAKAGLPES